MKGGGGAGGGGFDGCPEVTDDSGSWCQVDDNTTTTATSSDSSESESSSESFKKGNTTIYKNK